MERTEEPQRKSRVQAIGGRQGKWEVRGELIQEEGDKSQEDRIAGRLSEKVIRNHLLSISLKLHIHINLCIK